MKQALKKFPELGRMIRRATGRILHEPEAIIAKRTIGSDYGSHTVPAGTLHSTSIVYSFGIGTDVSFDAGVMEQFGCTIHGFDPTPKSIEWVKQQSLDDRFVFHPWGLDQCDGDMVFQEPEDLRHVSFSRASSSQKGIALPVKRLKTIMKLLGHERLDLLKLDIEGFEYAALEDMLACAIRPQVIAVEFHHRMYGIPNDRTLDAVKALRSNGYILFHVSSTGREYSFVLKP